MKLFKLWNIQKKQYFNLKKMKDFLIYLRSNMILKGKTTEQRFYKNNKDIFLKYFDDQATISASAYYDWLVERNIEKLKRTININK